MTALGPMLVDVRGTALNGEERTFLAHPQVGGVILFARNFESPPQLRELTAQIRSVRAPELLIAVDHEGGRVQRFREGFTDIPAMRRLGQLRESDAGAARELARAAGFIIGHELIAHSIDFSFAPVLDVDFGASSVIGDRAFSDEPETIAELAGALVAGLTEAGAAAVGKHFPGHGYVPADSHVGLPVDERDFAAIDAADLLPYRRLIPQGLAGVMPAHVIYSQVDGVPAGFSSKWLRDILRGRLGFGGMIFSDDLSMEGASVAGGIADRARAAIEAGCDMVLVCNAPEQARALADILDAAPLDPGRSDRMRAIRRVDARRYAEARALFDAEFA